MPRQNHDRIKELEAKMHEYVAEINRLEFNNASLQAQLNKARNEHVQTSGLRRQTRELYLELDGYILRTIDRRGYQRKPQKRRRTTPIDADSLDGMKFDQLLGVARRYDAEAYFRQRSKPAGMKLRYRLISKGYRSTRDLGKKSARHAYYLTRKVKRLQK